MNTATQAPIPGMMFACWSIVVMLVAVFLVFMRANKSDYAFAISPLLILPLTYVASGRLASWLALAIPMEPVELRILLNVVAALAACLLIGVTAQRITSPRPRRVFIGCCTGFLVILTLVLVINLLQKPTLA
ncbi:MAG: hypothetical protein ACOYJY_01895 [Acutalibacteraceae bacterium]|jgi:hypothetical protein